ncbi:MAG: hypothetical protein L3J59_16215 [Methylococcaceae bacterium]|nr:hypothetical protein [Methylococcaceae bacterium]
MPNPKQYDENLWKIQIKLANSMFAEGNVIPSIQHYHLALNIAKQLFIDFKTTEPLPDTLTHIVVISYLNLSDCWASQNNKKKQIHSLIESYDFLKTILNDHSKSAELCLQVYGGLSKIYLELCHCFKEIEADELLHKTEDDFLHLTALYQTQLEVIH